MLSQLRIEREAVESTLESCECPNEWPDTAAEFERMVLAYQDGLFRYAVRKLGNRQEAEDIVQDVFVKAFAPQGRPRNVARVSSYLYRMTANACNDVLRKRRRNPTRAEHESNDAIADEARAPDRQAAALEELRRIDDILGRLPRRQAQVLRLRILDGLGFAEIAEVVGCSLGTVKSRFRYGLLKLRTTIQNDWEELS